MENPEEILHSLEEFAKMKPKDIPRELEEYLKFVAKTGDPVYQWSAIKSLFREKLINVITDFYESCSSMDITPCPNVEIFNYDLMKNFILDKLDAFSAAPFTLQRICELLTSPKKEYSRVDKYMRALEKNILVVSTMEPGGRRTENGEGVVNGIESDHDQVPEPGNEINVEEMDDSPSWPQNIQTTNHITQHISYDDPKTNAHVEVDTTIDTYANGKDTNEASTSNEEIVCVQYVSIEPLGSDNQPVQKEEVTEPDVSVTITAINVNKPEESCAESTTEEKGQPIIEQPDEVLSTEAKSTDDQSGDNETDIVMETVDAPDNSSEPLEKDSVIIEEPVSSSSDNAQPNSVIEKPVSEPEQSQEVSTEPENLETETISPETTIITPNTKTETETSSSSEAEILKVESDTLIVESVETKSEIQKDDESEVSLPNNLEAGDSIVKSSSDDKPDAEVTEIKTVDVAPMSEEPEVTSEVIPDNSEECSITSNTKDASSEVAVEDAKIEKDDDSQKVAQDTLEDASETKIELPSSTEPEKGTPMDVDEEPLESNEEKEPAETNIKESSEPSL